MLAKRPIYALMFGLSAVLAAFHSAGVGCAEKAPVDPTFWSPPTGRPTPIVIPNETALKIRYDAATKKVDEYDKEWAQLPSHGCIVLMTNPNGPGAKAGLKHGDLILKVDDVEVKDEINSLRNGKVQKLTVQRYGSQNLEIEIQPGKLGIDALEYKRPTPPQLDAPPSDPRWKKHLDLAKKFYFIEPEAAEIALQQAVVAGLPTSGIVDTWFADLEQNQAHYARAMDYAWLAIKEGATADSVFKLFIDAANATYKLEAARDMLKKHPQYVERPTGTLARLAAEHLALTPQQRVRPSPLILAETLLKDDATIRTPSTSDAEWNHQYDELALNGHWQQEVKSDLNCLRPVGPGARNLLLRIQFVVRDTKPAYSGGPRFFAVRFFQDNPESVWSKPDFEVALSQQYLALGFKDAEMGSNLFLWPQFSDPVKVHDLSIAIIDGRTECKLDDIRLYYGPMDQDYKQLIPHILLVGTTLDIRRYTMHALYTEAEYRAATKSEANKAFRNSQTRLHRAAGQGLKKETEILLELGADPNLKDAATMTPIQYAARSGHAEIQKLLLAKGGKSPDANKAVKPPKPPEF